MKKTYISGKIGALPKEQVVINFAQAEAHLRDQGKDPFSPLSIPVPEHTYTSWSEFMLYDLLALIHYCDAIYLQKNWLQSPGARIDYSVAKELGYPVHYEQGLLRDPVIEDRIILTRVDFIAFHQESTRYYINREQEMRHIHRRRVRRIRPTAVILQTVHTYDLRSILSKLRALDPKKYIPQPTPTFT